MMKQRHRLDRQHNKRLNMFSSFQRSCLPAARGDVGSPGAPAPEVLHARWLEASTTGYIRTAKAPK